MTSSDFQLCLIYIIAATAFTVWESEESGLICVQWGAYVRHSNQWNKLILWGLHSHYDSFSGLVRFSACGERQWDTFNLLTLPYANENNSPSLTASGDMQPTALTLDKIHAFNMRGSGQVFWYSCILSCLLCLLSFPVMPNVWEIRQYIGVCLEYSSCEEPARISSPCFSPVIHTLIPLLKNTLVFPLSKKLKSDLGALKADV